MARRIGTEQPAGDPHAGVPVDYKGPRLADEVPDLCHRHYRTVIKGADCDMCRGEDAGESLPPWARVNPAHGRFVRSPQAWRIFLGERIPL